MSLLGTLLGFLVLLVFGGMVLLVGFVLRFLMFMLVSGRIGEALFFPGVGGVSFVELLILYERWAGERLVLEMSVPRLRRFNRPISVSAVPAGPSIDIWRSCRFLGAMLRALSGLFGGLGRFLPCRLGANHCRLRSVGWGEVWSWS